MDQKTQIKICYSLKVSTTLHDILLGGGASGVMVTVIKNVDGDKSSNPGQGWLHSTNTLAKSMTQNSALLNSA